MAKLRPPIPYSVRMADEILPVYPIPNNSDYNILRLSEDEIKRLEGTAAELRRLHQVNQELVEVAEMAAGIGLHTLPDRPKCGCSQCDMVNTARAVLAKLKEQA